MRFENAEGERIYKKACYRVFIYSIKYNIEYLSPLYFAGISLTLLICVFLFQNQISIDFEIKNRQKLYFFISSSALQRAVCNMIAFIVNYTSKEP